MKRARTSEPTGSDPTAVARRIEELSMVGHLASRLAGEMRQPLSVMRTTVYALNLNISPDVDEKARRHLTFLLRAVEEMNSIASNLEGLVGVGFSDRQAVGVDVLVAAALGRVQTRPGVTIETALEPDAMLFGGLTQISLALANIINNSVQAITGEASIRVVCQVVGGETRIVISDTGSGMSEEVRARVFELFFTTSPHRLGIGLTVAQRLVGAGGGTITVESSPGAGTTVTLAFPRYGKPFGGEKR